MANIQLWSTTAASNATADGDINWSEGQAPSTVNDSARQMMAALAAYNKDTNATIATGGSGTAFTITTNSSHASLTDGLKVRFKVTTANTGATTLAVDGLTAKNLKKGGGTDLASGDLVQNAVYEAMYISSADEFRLLSTTIPAGNITVSGNLSTTGTLSVTGASSFTGDVTFAGQPTVTGAAILLTASNAAIEIGKVGTSNTPFIDFHSSASSTDYDVRLAVTGGTASNGAGTLTLTASAFAVGAATTFSVKPTVSITSGEMAVFGGSGANSDNWIKLNNDAQNWNIGVDGGNSDRFYLYNGSSHVLTVSTDGNLTVAGTGAFLGAVLTLSASSAGLEMGTVGSSNSPFIDFHSSASSTDYDVRLQASGGTGSAGAGTLTLTAGSFTTAASITTTGGVNASGSVYKVSGTQVLGSRKTGWTNFASGTATRDLSAISTGSASTQTCAQVLNALLADLISHGIIGA